HFVGHGLFDEKLNDGALVFERPDGSAHEVPAENVGTLLRNERALRLAVLNACEGGRSSATDPYAGISQSLVRAGVPAVVGMQFAISDQAAIDFSRQLYRAVARGRPIDMAVTAARMAVYQGGSREWATPVLYLRSPDARIFDVGTAQDARVAPPAQAKRREVEQLVVAETLRRPSASPAKTAPSDWKRHLVRMGGAAVATWILFAIVVLGLERVLERPGAAWPANTNRGGLIYEAKLDAAGSALVPVFTSPTAVSQPHDGSHDLVVASAKSEIAVRLAYSPPERYAAEMLVEVRPGSTGLNLVWEVAQSGKITYTLELDPTAGSVVLRWNDNTATGGVLAQAPMRGTLSGRQIQLGIIIDAPRYVIVVDGAAAADGQDGALKPEVRPMAIHLFGNEQNASGTVTIYAIRVYALQ
ncbi:MAG TPA: CHAT domain-containing protein, partial [Candidatus Limnocylindria bacterium]|nr:CHAT domain-containing protein [Candidatus Limnocylindria bacterium]